MKKIYLIVAILVAALFMSSCSFSDDALSDPAFLTMRYEGGDTGGSKFKECVKEGDKLASNDRFYSYPTTQRQDKWDSENFKQGANSADYGDMELTDKNGIGVFLKITVPFYLNTSCEPLTVNGKKYPGGAIQAFHEIFGKTRNGYFDPTVDGNKSYADGWLWLMDTYISTCVTQVLTPKIRLNEAETLWLDDSKRIEIAGTLQDAIQTCVNNGMETDLEFYKIGNVTLDKITPEDTFVQLFRDRQQAETRANTAELNRDAQVAEAEAQEAVANAQAKVKLAEIRGYGGFDNYRCIYLADHGLNCAQPQYVVGGTK